MISIVSALHCTPADFEKAYAILILGYELTEVEVWGENYSRISKEEYQEFIDANEVLYAKIDGEVVGCIQSSKISEGAFTFGLLAADFSKKRLGIGRKLISTVEKNAVDNGAKVMHLEILKPEFIEVKSKVELHNWYVRLGYVYTETHSFVGLKPDKAEKAKLFVNPSVFDCYQKVLA